MGCHRGVPSQSGRSRGVHSGSRGGSSVSRGGRFSLGSGVILLLNRH